MTTTTKLNHGDNFSQQVNGQNPCIVCGKEIKAEKFMVEIDYVTGSVWSQAEGECPTSQGGFPVGSDCATKFAPGVLIKLGAVA